MQIINSNYQRHFEYSEHLDSLEMSRDAVKFIAEQTLDDGLPILNKLYNDCLKSKSDEILSINHTLITKPVHSKGLLINTTLLLAVVYFPSNELASIRDEEFDKTVFGSIKNFGDASTDYLLQRQFAIQQFSFNMKQENTMCYSIVYRNAGTLQ